MMATEDVRDIYNTLFKIESNWKTATYPVHKKLNFGENATISDVYEWLFENINFPSKGKILDVGCGAGFGSFFIAEKTNCEVTGISLSDKEVKSDNAVAQKKGVENNVKFLLKSFDEPFSEKYDLMVAVESVKHSLDLTQTLQNLTSALKPGGKLLIVEDYLKKGTKNKYIDIMNDDWALVEAYEKDDYTAPLNENFKIKSHDLTSFTLERNAIDLYVRYYLSEIATFFEQLFNRGKFWKIMRGGMALEILYRRREMTYEVLEIEKIA